MLASHASTELNERRQIPCGDRRAMTHGLAAAVCRTVPAVERAWYWEGNVQDTLASWLASEGWAVRATADTATREPGIDLLAQAGDRWLAVEVKGYPSTTYERGTKRGMPKPTQPASQARQWFSHALLGMMLLRDRRPDAEIALAFPRFGTYENLVARTQFSFSMLGFGVYFIEEGGDVELVVPHRSVDAGL